MAKKRKFGGGQQQNISDKIKYLRDEGVPQKQAVGEAYGMAKSGRLGAHGAYRRVGRKRSKSRR